MARLILLALIAATGCRFQVGRWQGAPPRAGNAVRIALHVEQPRAGELVQRAWSTDPKVEITPLDPAESEGGVTSDEGCAWAKAKGLEYFATASLTSSSTQDYKCTRYSLTLSKNETCEEGHFENQRSSATLAVRVYDVTTCTLVPSLSLEERGHVAGDQAEDRVRAEDEAVGRGSAKLPGFPAQVTLDSAGRITGDEPGFYAVFRGGTYRGTMQVDDVAAPGKMLTCCLPPAPGDALVRRGRITQFSFDPSFTLTQLTIGGTRHLAFGAGLHARYYKMDGGLEVTLDMDTVRTTGEAGGAAPFILSAGYGLRPTPALRLSLAAGGGLLYGVERRLDKGSSAAAPAGFVGARAIVTPVPWLYVGLEASVMASGTLDLPDPMQLRGGLARVFAGLSQ